MDKFSVTHHMEMAASILDKAETSTGWNVGERASIAKRAEVHLLMARTIAELGLDSDYKAPGAIGEDVKAANLRAISEAGVRPLGPSDSSFHAPRG